MKNRAEIGAKLLLNKYTLYKFILLILLFLTEFMRWTVRSAMRIFCITSMRGACQWISANHLLHIYCSNHCNASFWAIWPMPFETQVPVPSTNDGRHCKHCPSSCCHSQILQPSPAPDEQDESAFSFSFVVSTIPDSTELTFWRKI